MTKAFMTVGELMEHLIDEDGNSGEDLYMNDVVIHGYDGLTFVADDGTKLEFKLVEQDGGGRGGGEYCYSVFKIGDKFYKVEYSYYSYNGFENDSSDMLEEVKPVQRLVTFYE